MSNYYPPSPHSSMHGHQPVTYNTSHQSYGNGYLAPQPQYGNGYGHSGNGYSGSPVVISPSSRSRRRHHNSHRSHSRHGHSRPHHHHHHRSLGERILRWFGIGRHRSHRHNSKGWSFFGNNRQRARYVDAQTGQEVDRQGRAIYRV